jgi:hypothetical protein
MPSPFPGMDPYLEDPAIWPGFHQVLAAEMMAALNLLLLPDYYARVEERVYISNEEDPGRRSIIPDIRILPTGKKSKSKRSKKGGPALAVLECEPVEVTTVFDEEIHESFVKVIERKSKQVVTVIEILSPTNKVPGSAGREQYTAKREDVLRSQTHWVEIDLLRSGESVISRELYPPCEYTVHIPRVDRRPKATVWPIRLEHGLPRIPIPLKGRDPDLIFELQPVFDAVYDRSAYAIDVDYTVDPVPPLTPELAKWANKLLKQKQLR